MQERRTHPSAVVGVLALLAPLTVVTLLATVLWSVLWPAAREGSPLAIVASAVVALALVSAVAAAIGFAYDIARGWTPEIEERRQKSG